MSKFKVVFAVALVVVLLASAFPVLAQQPECPPPQSCDASLEIALIPGCLNRETRTGTAAVKLCNTGQQGTSQSQVWVYLTKGVGTVTPNVINYTLGPGECKTVAVQVIASVPYPTAVQLEARVMWESCRPCHNIGKSDTKDMPWCPPTAVNFSWGAAYKYPDGRVIVHWETASEIDNLGFNIYRGNGSQWGNARKINQSPIPASMGGVSGAYYTYLDATRPTSGWYWIEALDAHGGSQIFGPFKLKNAPAAKSFLVKVKTRSKLLITWIIKPDPASGLYELELTRGDIAETLITPNTSFERLNPTPGKYKVRVRAYRVGVWSNYKWFRID